MTILDSYAVLSFLKGEPASAEVEGLLLAGGAALSALGVAEVIDHLVRLGGVDEETALLDVAQLRLDPPLPVDGTALPPQAA